MIKTDETMTMLNDMAAKTSTNMNQLGELQLNTWNQLLQKQVATVNTVVENMMAQAQAMVGTKTIQEVVSKQADFNRDLAKTMVGNTNDTVEIMKDAATKYNTYAETTFQATVKDVQETVKEAAKKVTKAA